MEPLPAFQDEDSPTLTTRRKLILTLTLTFSAFEHHRRKLRQTEDVEEKKKLVRL